MNWKLDSAVVKRSCSTAVRASMSVQSRKERTHQVSPRASRETEAEHKFLQRTPVSLTLVRHVAQAKQKVIFHKSTTHRCQESMPNCWCNVRTLSLTLGSLSRDTCVLLVRNPQPSHRSGHWMYCGFRPVPTRLMTHAGWWAIRAPALAFVFACAVIAVVVSDGGFTVQFSCTPPQTLPTLPPVSSHMTTLPPPSSTQSCRHCSARLAASQHSSITSPSRPPSPPVALAAFNGLMKAFTLQDHGISRTMPAAAAGVGGWSTRLWIYDGRTSHRRGFTK